MATLTLAMIVRNEEGVLARCLDSIQELCDEIIICDTGSTDKTIEIAQKYSQAKVVHFKWVDDFGGARNHSFKHATQDLILWLDADDVIKPADFEKIKRFKQQNLDQMKDCYICPYQYSHDHLDNVSISLKRERIFKRSANPIWMYRIHECIPLAHFKTIDNHCDIEIHHYKTALQTVRAEGRNVKILKECVEDPAQTCARYEFYYGKELVDVNNDEAEKYLKKYLNHWEYYEDAFFATFQLAKIEFSRKNFDLAANYCFDSLKLDQRRGDVFCFLGLIYVNKVRWDLAAFWYRVALEMPKPEDSLGFFDMSQHTYIPHFQLGFVYYHTKEFEKSLHHSQEALKFRPNDPQATNNIKFAKLALGKTDVVSGKKKYAIYIYFNYDINNPNIRYRKVNLQKELRRKNIEADIVRNFKDLDNYDYILTHTVFSESEMNHLKLQGKIIAYDLAEGGPGVFDDVLQKMLPQYNLITCSSSKLLYYCKRNYNVNAVLLPDSFEA